MGHMHAVDQMMAGQEIKSHGTALCFQVCSSRLLEAEASQKAAGFSPVPVHKFALFSTDAFTQKHCQEEVVDWLWLLDPESSNTTEIQYCAKE